MPPQARPALLTYCGTGQSDHGEKSRLASSRTPNPTPSRDSLLADVSASTPFMTVGRRRLGRGPTRGRPAGRSADRTCIARSAGGPTTHVCWTTDFAEHVARLQHGLFRRDSAAGRSAGFKTRVSLRAVPSTDGGRVCVCGCVSGAGRSASPGGGAGLHHHRSSVKANWRRKVCLRRRRNVADGAPIRKKSSKRGRMLWRGPHLQPAAFVPVALGTRSTRFWGPARVPIGVSHRRPTLRPSCRTRQISGSYLFVRRLSGAGLAVDRITHHWRRTFSSAACGRPSRRRLQNIRLRSATPDVNFPAPVHPYLWYRAVSVAHLHFHIHQPSARHCRAGVAACWRRPPRSSRFLTANGKTTAAPPSLCPRRGAPAYWIRGQRHRGLASGSGNWTVFHLVSFPLTEWLPARGRGRSIGNRRWLVGTKSHAQRLRRAVALLDVLAHWSRARRRQMLVRNQHPPSPPDAFVIVAALGILRRAAGCAMAGAAIPGRATPRHLRNLLSPSAPRVVDDRRQ